MEWEGSSQCLGREYGLWGKKEAWSVAGLHSALTGFAAFGVLWEPQMLDYSWYL